MSPRKTIHSLLSYKCASREEFPIKIKRKWKNERRFPIKDRKKAKKKKEITDQRSEERKKEKEKENPNQRLEEDKEVNRKVLGPDNIWTKYGNVTSKKGNRDLRHMKWSPPWLPTKLLCASYFFAHTKQKQRKGTGRNALSQVSHQKHNSRKSPIDPWSCM